MWVLFWTPPKLLVLLVLISVDENPQEKVQSALSDCEISVIHLPSIDTFLFMSIATYGSEGEALPGEVVQPPCLETSVTQLDKAWSNLG